MRGLPLLEFLKHSLVCKADLKRKEGGNEDVFAYIDHREIFMFMRFVFLVTE